MKRPFRCTGCKRAKPLATFLVTSQDNLRRLWSILNFVSKIPILATQTNGTYRFRFCSSCGHNVLKSGLATYDLSISSEPARNNQRNDALKPE